MPPGNTLSAPKPPRPLISISVHQTLIIYSIHVYITYLSIFLKFEALTQQSDFAYFVFCFQKVAMYVIWYFIDQENIFITSVINLNSVTSFKQRLMSKTA